MSEKPASRPARLPQEWPGSMTGSYHAVELDGAPCPVCRSEVTAGAGFASGFAEYAPFTLRGRTAVTVTAAYRVDSAEILPSREGIRAKLNGNTVTFTLTEPGYYFVKLNGTAVNGNTAPHPLYLFADPPETAEEGMPEGKTVFFAPGIHPHRTYRLESDTTYYLTEGALVYGRFFADGAENIRICGRGTLCGEQLTDWYDEGRTVCIRRSRNITIEGICVLHPKVWTVACYGCRNVHIRRIKTIAHGMSSDGCDICGCRDVTVEDCFFRGHDDILAVKASEMITHTPWREHPLDCERVTFRRCTVWCDSSNAMTIGYETAGNVRGITFASIDVLSQSQPPVWQLEAVMAIEPHGQGQVEDVMFRDIRVDLEIPDRPVQSLFRLAVDGGSGTIRRVTFEDIWVRGDGALGGRILGRAGVPPVSEIVFRRVGNGAGRWLYPGDICRNGEAEIPAVEPLPGCPHVPRAEPYAIDWDYFDSQGLNGWYYRFRRAGDGAVGEMERVETDWRKPESHCCLIQRGFMHCDGTGDPLLTWKAPRTGTVSVSGTLLRPAGGGDGTLAYVLYNAGRQLWAHRLLPGTPKPVTMTLTVAVRQGDTLDFGTNMCGTPDFDGVCWSPVIGYLSEGEESPC